MQVEAKCLRSLATPSRNTVIVAMGWLRSMKRPFFFPLTIRSVLSLGLRLPPTAKRDGQRDITMRLNKVVVVKCVVLSGGKRSSDTTETGSDCTDFWVAFSRPIASSDGR